MPYVRCGAVTRGVSLAALAELTGGGRSLRCIKDNTYLVGLV
jgi:hypothetical protein